MFRDQMHYAEIPDLLPIVLPLRGKIRPAFGGQMLTHLSRKTIWSCRTTQPGPPDSVTDDLLDISDLAQWPF